MTDRTAMGRILAGLGLVIMMGLALVASAGSGQTAPGATLAAFLPMVGSSWNRPALVPPPTVVPAETSTPALATPTPSETGTPEATEPPTATHSATAEETATGTVEPSPTAVIDCPIVHPSNWCTRVPPGMPTLTPTACPPDDPDCGCPVCWPR